VSGVTSIPWRRRALSACGATRAARRRRRRGSRSGGQGLTCARRSLERTSAARHARLSGGCALARLLRRRPIAATIASAAITTGRPSSTAGPNPDRRTERDELHDSAPMASSAMIRR
jgi:hypothetical protein